MTLGAFIARLATMPHGASIVFEFCDLRPTRFDSYRGYYDQLALGWTQDGFAPKVSDVLAAAKAAIGATFTGWKGGNYTMDQDTPLWVDNPGECSSTRIIGLRRSGDHYVYIMTETEGA